VADKHENENGKVVRGQRVRAQHRLSSDDPLHESGHDPYAGNDLVGIQADDALLDALSGKSPESSGQMVDDELSALLLAWRREVDSRPYGDLVDTDTAVATIAAARHTRHSKHRFLIPLASAAAVLAIAFTGVSLVARDAQPGDALWGLTRVLYSEHAKSIEAAVAVRTDLDVARAALSQGRIDEAKDALEKAGASLPSVSDNDGKANLSQDHETLLEKLTSTAPTLPSVPSSHPTSSSSPQATTEPTTTTDPTTTTTEPPTSAVTTTPSQPSGSTDDPNPPTPPASGGEPGEVGGRTAEPTPAATSSG